MNEHDSWQEPQGEHHDQHEQHDQQWQEQPEHGHSDHGQDEHGEAALAEQDAESQQPEGEPAGESEVQARHEEPQPEADQQEAEQQEAQPEGEAEQQEPQIEAGTEHDGGHDGSQSTHDEPAEELIAEQSDPVDAAGVDEGVAVVAEDVEFIAQEPSRARVARSRPTTSYSRLTSIAAKTARRRPVAGPAGTSEDADGLTTETVQARIRLSVGRLPNLDVSASTHAVVDRAAAPARAARLEGMARAHRLRAGAAEQLAEGREQAAAKVSASLAALQSQAAARTDTGREKVGEALHRAADPVVEALHNLRERVSSLRDRHGNLPHLEMPKVDMPKVDLSKVELPKVELPKVDLPKVELPKVEGSPLSQPLAKAAEMRDDLREELQDLAKGADRAANEAIVRARKLAGR